MPYFDSHCHLQDPRFQGRIPELLGRARAAGVQHLVCCGTREQDWDRVLDLARDHAGIVPMLGLHPWYVAAAPGWLDRLRSRLNSARAGLGECGLDFAPGRPERALQEAAFTAQLALARDLDRPLAIHCVRAWGRLLALLRQIGLPRAGAMVHGFSGSREVAAELQGLGVHLSFSGPGRPGVLAAVAAEWLLLETDAPFGPGPSHEPADLALLLPAAAAARGGAASALAAQVQSNGQRLFGSLMA
jgi:TatD DNase family protein